jgi:amidase
MCPTAANVAAALDGLADQLSKIGCTILRNSPKLPDLALTTRIYAEQLFAFYGALLPAAARDAVAAAARSLTPDDQSFAAARLRGLTTSHPDWAHTGFIRSGLRARWQALFQDVDVVICPPMPAPAFPHDHSPQQTRQLDIDGREVTYLHQGVWAAVATLNGLPATTMPIRHLGDMPIGVQIIGGFLDDNTTIAFASMIERELGGFAPPPGL